MNALAFPPAMGPPQAPVRLDLRTATRDRMNGLLSALLKDLSWFDYVDVLEWEYEELKALVATGVLFDQPTVLGGFGASNIDQPTDGTSNMGTMSRFPLEVIHVMIEHMDFLTLERFSRTCHYARVAARNHPTYKLLMQHAANLPKLMMSIKIIYWNSLRMLKAELQFPNCRSCGSLSSFLYIPTCERLCRNCSEFDKNYWIIEILSAKYAFNIGAPELRLIPLVHLTASTYHGPHFPATRQSLEILCPVKSAIEIAVKRWGSMALMREAAEQVSPDRFADSSDREYADAALFRYIRSDQPPLDPNISEQSMRGRLRASDVTSLASAACTSFPYVPPPRAEPSELFYCKGCKWCVEKQLAPLPDALEYMGIDTKTDKSEIATILVNRARIARNWPDLFVHIISCLGCCVLMWEARATDSDRQRIHAAANA
ncbi:hypothetical protein N7488_009879 [Penicillium malachiteum]|nr:hypothetical protein N7488_009879 [Penicillium malachiteum]